MVTDLTTKLRKEQGDSLARQLAILEQYSQVESRVPSAAAIELMTKYVGHIVGFQINWAEHVRLLLEEQGDREWTRSALTNAVALDREWQTVTDFAKGFLDRYLSGHPNYDHLAADLRRTESAMADTTRRVEEALIRLRGAWTPNDPDRLAAGLAEARAGQGLAGDEMIAAIRARRT